MSSAEYQRRCLHVSPSPWGPTQCALPRDHEGRHAYDPLEYDPLEGEKGNKPL